MKINGSGKAAIFSPKDLQKLRRVYKHPAHRMMLEIAVYTAERWGAIRQLRVEDCYESDRKTPRSHILYRRETRKGKKDSRIVPVIPALHQYLSLYEVPAGELMFPGAIPGKPISKQGTFKYFQRACEEAGLVGYGLHSTRRTTITLLHEQGVSLEVIRQITGHRRLNSLQHYLTPSEEACKKALMLLE